jgi:hypothetical protein
MKDSFSQPADIAKNIRLDRQESARKAAADKKLADIEYQAAAKRKGLREILQEVDGRLVISYCGIACSGSP